MIQLFMSRSGSSVIVPLNLPASHGAMTEAYSQLEQANRTGKTEIVEIKSVIANLPSYLGGLDPDSRTQLAQLNLLSSIIAKMDSRERSIYAGALDGNSINDLNDMIRVAEQVSDYTSIDEELDGWSFRDRAQYTLDLGAEGVWGDCAVYEYKYAGPGSNYHPANDVQAVFVGELTITREQYELTVKKVDSTNPSKGLSGARFLIQSANGTYSKEFVTGSDGTYTLSSLDAGTYSVTEMAPPEGYEIDNAGPRYVVLPNESGTTVTVTFTDTPVITSEGSIRKVDSDDPSKGLAGAVIKIEGVDNSFTGTYTTGVGGYLQDVPWDTMPIGSYVATEVTPPNGYTISKDPDKVRQEFYWDGKSDVDLVFENDAKVKLELLKVPKSRYNTLVKCLLSRIPSNQVR